MRIKIIMAAVAMLLTFAGANSRAEGTNGVIALVNASILFEEQANYSEALRQMEAALTLAAEDYLIQLRLGWLYYLNQDNNLSEKHYRRALSLSADRSIEALLGLTLPLAAREEWTQVEAVYLSILKLEAENYEANLHLGQIYFYRDDSARAQKYLERALTNYPSSYEANLTAGWMYEALGKRQRAAECFRRALMLSPADTSAARGLEAVK